MLFYSFSFAICIRSFRREDDSTERAEIYERKFSRLDQDEAIPSMSTDRDTLARRELSSYIRFHSVPRICSTSLSNKKLHSRNECARLSESF